MKSHPFWYEFLPTNQPVEFSQVNDDFETSLLVIGGGLSGLSCAYFALLHGAKVLVVESRGLCDGATGRNGGHQWGQTTSDPDTYSAESQCSAIESSDILEVRSFISSLDSDWQERISVTVSGGMDVCLKEELIPHLVDYESCVLNVDANENHIKYEDGSDGGELPGNSLAGLLYPNAAHFNPGMLLLALAETIVNLGGVIWTHAEVVGVVPLEKNLLEVHILGKAEKKVQVQCMNIAHCWNGYGNAKQFLPDRLSTVIESVRGQVVSLKNDHVSLGTTMVYKSTEDSLGEYLIKRNDRFIFGGMRHRCLNKGVGFQDDSQPEQAVSEALLEEFNVFFKSNETEISHAWSGIMCFPDDDRPIVGAIAELPNQFLSIGFGGHGMVRAFSCGKHIAELICGVPVSLPVISQVFNPNRFQQL